MTTDREHRINVVTDALTRENTQSRMRNRFRRYAEEAVDALIADESRQQAEREARSRCTGQRRNRDDG